MLVEMNDKCYVKIDRLLWFPCCSPSCS